MNKKGLRLLSYGMYIVSSIKNGKPNAQIANTLFQVTSDPPIVAVSINKENLTHEYIKKSRLFGVTVISEKADFKFIANFGFKSGKNFDKFEGVNFKYDDFGIPFITDNATAILSIKVIDEKELLTHTLFFGELMESEILSNEPPMSYNYYHNVIKGKSPKKAPTYIDAK